MELTYLPFLKNTGWVGNIPSPPHISNGHPNSHMSHRKELRLGSGGISFLWIALQLSVLLVFGTSLPSSACKIHTSEIRVSTLEIDVEDNL